MALVHGVVLLVHSQNAGNCVRLENLQFQNYGERTINEVKFSDIFSEYKPGFLFQAKQVCLALRGHNSTAVSAQEAVKSVQLLKRIYS